MGLSVAVGVLAELSEVDPEGQEAYRGFFAVVNELLTKHGLPSHVEPEQLPAMGNRCELDSYPYSFLHHLRRVFARRVSDPEWKVTPMEEGDRSDDRVVEAVTMRIKSHLLYHSDAEGFYVPVDFREVLVDKSGNLPGAMLGSSYRLLEELAFVAPALGIRLDGNALPDDEADAVNRGVDAQERLWIERIVWLSLYEAARLSIQHGTAICFT